MLLFVGLNRNEGVIYVSNSLQDCVLIALKSLSRLPLSRIHSGPTLSKVNQRTKDSRPDAPCLSVCGKEIAILSGVEAKQSGQIERWILLRPSDSYPHNGSPRALFSRSNIGTTL